MEARLRAMGAAIAAISLATLGAGCRDDSDRASAGGADVRVVVLFDDDGADFTPALRANATTLTAAVMLVGTDAGSSGGLGGTTDAAGAVTFTGVTGPFTVTAQIDHQDGGRTVRRAVTVVDIAPPAGEIGILIRKGRDDSTAPISATLTVTVENVPAIPQGSGLSARAFSRFDHALFGPPGGAPLPPTFAIAVVPGTYSVFAGVVDSFGISRAAFFPTLVTVAAGQTVALPSAIDFADAAQAATFSAVTVTFEGQPASASTGGVFHILRGPGGTFFHPVVAFAFPLFPGPVPSSFTASFAQTLPGGFSELLRVTLEQDETPISDFAAQHVFQPLGVTSSAIARFEPIPSISSPLAGATLTAAEAAALTATFALAGTTANLAILGLSDGDGGPGDLQGVDGIDWSIYFLPGRTSLALPPVALPMFGAGGEFGISVTQMRVGQGQPLDLADLFGPDVEARFADLLPEDDSTVRSESERPFDTAPP